MNLFVLHPVNHSVTNSISQGVTVFNKFFLNIGLKLNNRAFYRKCYKITKHLLVSSRSLTYTVFALNVVLYVVIIKNGCCVIIIICYFFSVLIAGLLSASTSVSLLLNDFASMDSPSLLIREMENSRFGWHLHQPVF